MEIPISTGKYHQTGGFSMAMLVYQRVARVVFRPRCPLHFNTSPQTLACHHEAEGSWNQLTRIHREIQGLVTWPVVGPTGRWEVFVVFFPEFSMVRLWEEQKMAVQIWIDSETCSTIWRWDFLENPGYLFGVHDYPWLYEGSLDPSTYESRIKPSYFPLNPGCLMTGSFVVVYYNPHIPG